MNMPRYSHTLIASLSFPQALCVCGTTMPAWLSRVCEISGPHRGVICCCGKELAGNKVAVHHTALQGLCHKCGNTSANMSTLGIRTSSAHIPQCALRNALKCSERDFNQFHICSKYLLLLISYWGICTLTLVTVDSEILMSRILCFKTQLMICPYQLFNEYLPKWYPNNERFIYRCWVDHKKKQQKHRSVSNTIPRQSFQMMTGKERAKIRSLTLEHYRNVIFCFHLINKDRHAITRSQWSCQLI